jgi:hypothetical protein
MSKIEWQSTLTYDDVKHLPYEVKEQLIDELTSAVVAICTAYAVPNFDEPIEEEKE